MSAAPKVSVCVDSYNYGRYLPQALESVLTQSFADLEVVVLDDCSTDDSFAIAQRFAARDSRIRAFQNEQNLGMVRNRNACLRLARGEYVKWLHADDFLCTPDVLQRMVDELERNRAVSLVATARQIVGENSQPVDVWSCFQDRRPLAGTTVINRCLLEQRNLVAGPSAVMFRRGLSGRGFDEAFFVMADLEMWFHLLEQGCFAFLAESLCAFRTHGRSKRRKTARASHLHSKMPSWCAAISIGRTCGCGRGSKITCATTPCGGWSDEARNCGAATSMPKQLSRSSAAGRPIALQR
jgi:glycosyltransferase involved in cell wall biosynthesis